ncbi:hypothetical protein BX600DRAFT_100183 [Xylariales sp. PMI_506]|nr:hypothetical protein BX600DRAFT_100183 [Xylariales sp. PMI_506]
MMDASSRKVEKRNRPPVSCEPCRTRKLKCNRGLPCDACIKRERSSLCLYAANANRSRPGTSKAREMKDRLNNLESLVSSFISGDAVIPSVLLAQSPSSSTPEDSAIVSSLVEQYRRSSKQGSILSNSSGGEGVLTPETPHLQETRDGQVNYIDPSHWLSILDDIKEVREHLSHQPLSQTATGMGVPVQPMGSDASFLFDARQASSLEEIIASLPSQPICDMLLSWYFNSSFMILGIIHPGKFQKEYAAFWESPTTAPPLWIALLFSVLSMTIALRRIANTIEPEGSIPPLAILQQRTVDCLTLGRYATANAHALEAFILHLQGLFFSQTRLPIDPWFAMGTIIRLAFRMGYHRDPSTLAGITPFDGEMRRRVWLNIFQIDALISFQLGFPSMIPTEFCDTEVPRNLEYSDLYEDMPALPPSRPLSEQTPVLYIIVKAGVMAVFKKIVAHTQSLAPPSYDKTIALDTEMNRVYSAVPESLRRRDVNRCFLDQSVLIWQRCTVELLHLKGLVVLHRRYISYELLPSPKYEPSRRACVEAALDILYRHADLYHACEPGGRLHAERWMFFSLPVHDFLLAAMVVCLDLSVNMRSRNSRDYQQDPSLSFHSSAFSEQNQRQNQKHDTGREYQELLAGREYQALQTSQKIWAASSASSPEAHIAALALELMLKKVASNNNVNTSHSQDAAPQQEQETSADPVIDSELPYAGPMSQMIDGFETIDWSLLDQYLQNMDPSVSDTTF